MTSIVVSVLGLRSISVGEFADGRQVVRIAPGLGGDSFLQGHVANRPLPLHRHVGHLERDFDRFAGDRIVDADAVLAAGKDREAGLEHAFPQLGNPQRLDIVAVRGGPLGQDQLGLQAALGPRVCRASSESGWKSAS